MHVCVCMYRCRVCSESKERLFPHFDSSSSLYSTNLSQYSSELEGKSIVLIHSARLYKDCVISSETMLLRSKCAVFPYGVHMLYAACACCHVSSIASPKHNKQHKLVETKITRISVFFILIRSSLSQVSGWLLKGSSNVSISPVCQAHAHGARRVSRPPLTWPTGRRISSWCEKRTLWASSHTFTDTQPHKIR